MLQVQPDAASTFINPRYNGLHCSQAPTLMKATEKNLQELFAEFCHALAPALATIPSVQLVATALQITAAAGGISSTGHGLWDLCDSIVTVAIVTQTAASTSASANEDDNDVSSELTDEIKTYLKDPPIGRANCPLKW